jgi:hypothetical protein
MTGAKRALRTASHFTCSIEVQLLASNTEEHLGVSNLEATIQSPENFDVFASEIDGRRFDPREVYQIQSNGKKEFDGSTFVCFFPVEQSWTTVSKHISKTL